MKPIFLIFFFLMVISSLAFAVVYVSIPDFVERNSLTFSVGLVTVMIVGMFGMINSIISETTTSKQTIY